MQRPSGSAGRPADHSAESSSDKGGSAQQPVTPLHNAEQPLSSLAHSKSAEQLLADAGGEMQPNKRCKHDGMMVSSKDFILPEILQPIKAALAEEIDKFKIQCEQWDPANFGEDATQEDKPKLLMPEIYKRLRSKRVRACLPAYTPAQHNKVYAVIKGLLALLHSDVPHCFYNCSQKKQKVANDLYADWCSHGMQEIDLHVNNVELLALATRQQMINDNKANSKHATRYLKYLADFAESHAL